MRNPTSYHHPIPFSARIIEIRATTIFAFDLLARDARRLIILGEIARANNVHIYSTMPIHSFIHQPSELAKTLDSAAALLDRLMEFEL